MNPRKTEWSVHVEGEWWKMLNDHTFCIRDQLEWSRVSTDQVKIPRLYSLFREKARRSELQTTVYCGVGSVRKNGTSYSYLVGWHALQSAEKVGHIEVHVSSFLKMRPLKNASVGPILRDEETTRMIKKKKRDNEGLCAPLHATFSKNVNEHPKISIIHRRFKFGPSLLPCWYSWGFIYLYRLERSGYLGFALRFSSIWTLGFLIKIETIFLGEKIDPKKKVWINFFIFIVIWSVKLLTKFSCFYYPSCT